MKLKPGEVPCHWPGGIAHKADCGLEIQIEGHIPPAFVRLPFCNYHFNIIMSGRFHSKQEMIDTKTGKSEFELIGPFEQVELIEQVMAARELAAKANK